MVEPGDFNGDLNSDKVAEYDENFESVSDRRWEVILKAYGIDTLDEDQDNLDDDDIGNRSRLDLNRRKLYLSSSP